MCTLRSSMLYLYSRTKCLSKTSNAAAVAECVQIYEMRRSDQLQQALFLAAATVCNMFGRVSTLLSTTLHRDAVLWQTNLAAFAISSCTSCSADCAL